MQQITITEKEENQRFDKFLSKYFKNATMGFLYKMLRKKNITLNGKKASGSEKLQKGDHILIFFSEETFLKMKGSHESKYSSLRKLSTEQFMVIYEEEDFLVCNKPAGVLSQKATENDISMNELFLAYLIQTNQLTSKDFEIFHPSIANRLDRNTSGLLLAGKTLKGQQYLSEMIQKREVKKIYHCLVKGDISKGQHLKGFLLKNEDTNEVSIYSNPVPMAKAIETKYLPLERFGEYTLLEVHLITGRSHQIRAHLASISHEIIGDNKYGSIVHQRIAKERFGINRQMLHAYSIELPNNKHFEAPYPKDFLKTLSILRGIELWQPGIQED